MKKVIAILLTLTTVLAVASCGKKPEPDATESLTKTTESTTDTSETTDVTTSATETSDVDNSQIEDLCELMRSLTGMRTMYAVALVEEFYKQKTETKYLDWETSTEIDEEGYNLKHTYYYMNVTSGKLSFNEFIFTANEEYGNVYKVRFVCSTSKNNNSLKPFDYTTEELRSYYSMIESEFTKLFGSPVESELPEDNNPGSRSYSVFKDGIKRYFRVDYNPAPEEEVTVTYYSNIEKQRFLGPPSDSDAEMYYKDATKDDVVFDKESGISYIKNQLLVSCHVGIPNDKEKMQKVCEEIGAEIVGYLQLTSDFQIEFDRDLTYDELMKIAKELEEKYYFIASANVNFAVSYGDDMLD